MANKNYIQNKNSWTAYHNSFQNVLPSSILNKNTVICEDWKREYLSPVS